MFCDNCGNKINEEDKFCDKCGKSFSIKKENINKVSNMDKVVKYVSIAGILIIALAIAYYLVIFLLKKEEMKIELQKQEQLAREKELNRLQKEKEANKKDLESCLLQATSVARNFWEGECESMGKGEDCRLPEYNANRIDESLKEDEANCFKKYPQD